MEKIACLGMISAIIVNMVLGALAQNHKFFRRLLATVVIASFSVFVLAALAILITGDSSLCKPLMLVMSIAGISGCSAVLADALQSIRVFETAASEFKNWLKSRFE